LFGSPVRSLFTILTELSRHNFAGSSWRFWSGIMCNFQWSDYW